MKGKYDIIVCNNEDCLKVNIPDDVIERVIFLNDTFDKNKRTDKEINKVSNFVLKSFDKFIYG